MNLDQAKAQAKAAQNTADRLQAAAEGRAAEERARQKAAEDSRKLLGKFAVAVVSLSVQDSQPVTKEAFSLWAEYLGADAQREYLKLAYDVLTHPISGATDLKDTKGLTRSLEASLSQVLPGDSWMRSLQTSILQPDPQMNPAQRRTLAADRALEAYERPAMEPPQGLTVSDLLAARAALGMEQF